MKFRRSLAQKLLFAVSAVGVFFLSYYLGNRYARHGLDGLQAFIFPRPAAVTQFSLVDKNGAPFDETAFKGHWNFLLTGMPDRNRCRSLLFRYMMAWNYLAGDPKLQQKTRVVFLDTSETPTPPGRLKAFIDFYNPAFTAITGAASQRRRLARQIGLPKGDLSGVQCDSQNGVVALINPDGMLLALFTGVTDPKAIAHDLRSLL